MSLVPTWVLAQDGKLYEEPELEPPAGEPRDWFIVFDDDDPPELVVRLRGKTTRREVKALATAALETAGIKNYRIRSGPHFSGRLFERSGYQFHRAAGFFLELTEPIPVPQKFDSVSETYPQREGVFYTFGREVGQEQE